LEETDKCIQRLQADEEAEDGLKPGHEVGAHVDGRGEDGQEDTDESQEKGPDDAQRKREDGPGQTGHPDRDVYPSGHSGGFDMSNTGFR
jgi:hypothetical protein